MNSHSCETHRVYRLTCAQYDELVTRFDGACWRCHRAGSIWIDHDHAIGLDAVRGMLCPECNSRLGRVDAGSLDPDELDTAYLRDAWHATRAIKAVADGRTPVRMLRMVDGLWHAALEKAEEEGTTVSEHIRAELAAWTGYVEDTE